MCCSAKGAGTTTTEDLPKVIARILDAETSDVSHSGVKTPSLQPQAPSPSVNQSQGPKIGYQPRSKNTTMNFDMDLT